MCTQSENCALPCCLFRNASSDEGGKEASVSKEEAEGGSETTDHNDDYLASLQALNEGVLSWISEHLKNDPHVDLSPVFDDYRKHMTDLDRRFLTTTPVTKARKVAAKEEEMAVPVKPKDKPFEE